MKMCTRDFYQLRLNFVKPTALKRWEEEGFTPDAWTTIFRIRTLALSPRISNHIPISSYSSVYTDEEISFYKKNY